MTHRLRQSTARARCAVAFLLLLCLLVMGAVGGFVASVDAAETHPFTGTSFGPEGPESEVGFKTPESVAIDETTGNVFVFDIGAGLEPSVGRLYKFDLADKPAEFSASGTNWIEVPRGGFSSSENEVAVATAGKTAGDIYVSTGQAVKIYSSSGTEIGELSGFEGGACGVAVDSAGDVYVGSRHTIRKFIPTADPVTTSDEAAHSSAPLTEETATCRVAADGADHIYGAEVSGQSVTKLAGISDPTGTLIKPGGQTLAVDQTSNDLFIDRGSSVAQYSPEGNLLGTFGGTRLKKSVGIAALGSTGELFVANGETKRIEVFGPGETAKPILESDSVSSSGASEAILRVKINPNGTATTLYAEYGADASYGQQTAKQLIGGGESSLSVPIPLKGLAPGVTYHFRIVVESDGAPVPGPDRTFRTYAADLETNCGNQTLRTGASAKLPDCRAYEMVSPVDKNGSDIATNFSDEVTGRASYDKAANSGSELTYSAGVAFADQTNSTGANQYLSARTVSGWSTRGLNLPVAQLLESQPGVVNLSVLDPAYRFFSDDLAEGLVNDFSVTPRAPGAAVGIPNLYRRDIASGTLHALTNQPSPEAPLNVEAPYRLEAVTPSGNQVMFNSTDRLTGNSFPSQFSPQTYLSANGNLILVSIKPNGEPYEFASNLTGRLSSDGTSAYWRGSFTNISSNGSIFLRRNPNQPQSALENGSAVGIIEAPESGVTEIHGVHTTAGEFRIGQELWSLGGSFGPAFLQPHTKITAVGNETLTVSQPTVGSGSSVTIESGSPCSEASKACTIRVSEAIPGGTESRLYAISANGEKAFFVVEGGFNDNKGHADQELYEFNQSENTYHLIASKVTNVPGASADGSKLYFISDEALGSGSIPGSENLYFFDNGTISFIATLLQADVAAGEGVTSLGTGGDAQSEFLRRGSRVTPDGNHFLFMSASSALSERVAGYSNVDLNSGENDREVYLFSSGSGLRCVSCNPSGAQPVGQKLERSFQQPGGGKSAISAAAWIPGEEHELLAQRVLSSDGARVFFNSFDSIAPSDGNGAQDVYEWELPGTGRCREDSSSFSPQDGGCINLISSGESPDRSEFIDASDSGDDVFFTTGSSLVPQDDGLVDVYDARVEGGFPPPSGLTAACEGEACQGVIVPPSDRTPSSATYTGPANVKASRKHHRKKKHRNHKHEKRRKGGKSKSRPNKSTRRVGG